MNLCAGENFAFAPKTGQKQGENFAFIMSTKQGPSVQALEII
jgi:hypothetical protein